MKKGKLERVYIQKPSTKATIQITKKQNQATSFGRN